MGSFLLTSLLKAASGVSKQISLKLAESQNLNLAMIYNLDITRRE